MGIQSDVFFAHKACVSLPQEHVDMLVNRFGAVTHTNAEGTAYSMQSVKWYRDSDKDLEGFYIFLDMLYSSDYIVIEACHDYPGSTESDAGGWYDNPWEAYRFVRTGIEFNTRASKAIQHPKRKG